MALESRSPAILRFGTYEVDLRAGELRKQGKRVKLQEQPFQVLAVLLQRPGEVVTREELRTQNWPADTFVDFDNSLNTAINKLREALGDSAENPRFIETLPRRGYRFLAPVSGDGREARTKSTDKWKIGMIAGIVVVAGAVAVGAGMLWHSRQGRVLSEKDTIVLGDFANSTGDPVFDGTLREGLSVQLEQSPFLSLMSDEGIHQTLHLMGQQANARLAPEVTREVCQRTNSASALHGSIALIGTQYNLVVKAVNCLTGELLASTEAQASDKNHVLDALGRAASEMRRKLGESLSTLQKYNTPLEQATTPSLEALQAYSLGLKSWNENDALAAVSLFQRATRLDPNFAMAYWAMGWTYAAGIGESALAAENLRKAFELRRSVSEREKLIIESDYYLGGDLAEGRRTSVLGEKTYPREAIFHVNLGELSIALGQFETALKEHLEGLRLAPYSSLHHRYVIFAYLSLNRVEDAVAAAEETHTKGLDSNLAPILYAIAFYRDDTAGLARHAASAAGKPGEEDFLLALQADTAAYFGHLGQAREFSRQAVGSAERTGKRETATSYYVVSALREALFGNTEKARQAVIGRKPSVGHDTDYGFALALAYAGEANEAQVLAGDLNKRFPEDTVIQFIYQPTLQAKLALSRANPQQALDHLRVAAPYELGLPAFSFYNWPNLYPVYVRGEAYLAAHQGREAAAEFQKILDHRGIVLNEPIGALAHLQLGRAFAMSGDTAKARAAYQDFLTLWKDADPDIPILKEAKTEYAKLQ
jgi:DNA-binding winged helix-turn-helix (wHTH) protein